MEMVTPGIRTGIEDQVEIGTGIEARTEIEMNDMVGGVCVIN